MKKTVVLVVLFVLPLVVYLFFATGVTRFGILPALSGPVQELSAFEGSEKLEGNISILGFLGTDIENKKGVAFNLNQKIYKPYYEFKDFQVIMIVPKNSEVQVASLVEELSGFTDTSGWKFAYGEPEDIKSLFQSLETDLELGEDLSSPYVFILDKERMLRGRDEDEDGQTKYGFDATSVADLNNKMKDDVKIILAEYRRALKKNNKYKESAE
ncbi:hypothetical protein SAMN04490243_0615 [Robiginitalea myxolifaciens]|uniref:Uncharacterized protein n=1 Tax=Robiginitalea myxolifaciens TaxID=400055 RepID=A0A1I6FTJ6_9FLAO|nr:hypothetical protein [Robiginitalea myxolifaciens]SFR33117.1 hypothetical protein SAMN04490243_0615 [Robiginitalea myxolifaciens]